MPIKQYPIVSLADMIAEFDLREPKPGRETSAFIKRWRQKELSLKHNGSVHLSIAVHDINPEEIESIRSTKKVRDAERYGNNMFVEV